MLDAAARDWLSGRFQDGVKFDEPMGRYTSLGVGGAAEALVFPRTREDVMAVMTGAWERKIPYLVVGGGTNLLVTDAGVSGIVINLSGGLRRIERVADPEGGIRVLAEAGVSTRRLCRFCLSGGLGGMEFILGIPGTVGGAIRMNAGAGGGSMSGRLHYIEVVYPMGAPRRIYREHLHGGYRSLSWDRVAGETDACPPVVLGGCFDVDPASPDELKAAARHAARFRAASQPGYRGSAGCFFKNPSPETPAGRFIEEAGLKGSRRGGAVVSEKHANFILNGGRATAEDILGLMKTVQRTVFDKFGILLEPEVQIIGEETDSEK
jgi:UDP-N-acetylmuramate dehydrogenase